MAPKTTKVVSATIPAVDPSHVPTGSSRVARVIVASIVLSPSSARRPSRWAGRQISAGEVSDTRPIRAQRHDAGMKTLKANRSGSRKPSKTRHPTHRSGPGGGGGRYTARAIGGPMDAALLDQILAAFEGVGSTDSWDTIATRVLPLLKRVRQPYPAEAAPIHVTVAPGIAVGFGIDLGPAFTHITPGQLERWGIDLTTVLATALDNLSARITSEPPIIEPMRGHGLDAIVIQAQGWASALVLAPDRLREILGPEPRILLTPVRNALVSLPSTSSSASSWTSGRRSPRIIRTSWTSRHSAGRDPPSRPCKRR